MERDGRLARLAACRNAMRGADVPAVLFAWMLGVEEELRRSKEVEVEEDAALIADGERGLLRHVVMLIDYWAGEKGSNVSPDMPKREALSGLAFSMLVMLDGGAEVGPYTVRELHDDETVGPNIAGSLHEMLHRYESEPAVGGHGHDLDAETETVEAIERDLAYDLASADHALPFATGQVMFLTDLLSHDMDVIESLVPNADAEVVAGIRRTFAAALEDTP